MRREWIIVVLWLFGSSPSTAQDRARTSALLKAVEAQVAPWTGRRLAGPAKLACDISVCSKAPIGGNLAALVNLHTGDLITQVAVQAAWSRLKRTGFFSNISLEFIEGKRSSDAGPAPVYLTFLATGTVVIQELNIEYDSWRSSLYPKQFIAEIRKRLPLRRGGAFPVLQPDGSMSAADLEVVETYEKGVVELYERRGIEGTVVKIKPSYFGPNNKKVIVTVHVSEGRQPEIGEILVKGAKAFPYWKVVQHFSTGERADFWRNFFALFGVGRYSRRDLKEESQSLEAQYRQEGWVSARVRIERRIAKQRGQIYPLLHIHEGPRLLVKFEGNTGLSDDDLQAVLTFKESGAFDEPEIEASVEQIIAAYQATARYFVSVETEKVRVHPNLYTIRFKIDEGPKVFARRIEIVGHKNISRAEILAAMETKGIAEDGVINAVSASDGIVQDAKLINDLGAIRALYRSKGMPAVRFRCANPKMNLEDWNNRIKLPPKPKPKRWQWQAKATRNAQAKPTSGQQESKAAAKKSSHRNAKNRKIAPPFDIWSDDTVGHRCYQVKRDIDPRLLVVRIELSEGLRTNIESIRIQGLIRGMDDEMADEALALLELQGFIDEFGRRTKSVGFNQARVKAIQGFLLRYLHQEGFLTAEVTPRCEYGKNGVALGSDCSEDAMYGLNIKTLGFDINKGVRTTVSGILLNGNLATKNYLLLDELLMEPGSELGSDELFISQANLRSLGVFDAVNVSYIAQDSMVTGAINTGFGEESGDDASNALTTDRSAMVLVTVEESKAKLLDFYLGLQIDSTPIDGELPILYSIGTSARDRNLFGYALELGVGASHSNQFEAIDDVENDYAVWRAGPFFKNNRFLGTRLSLIVESLFERSRTVQGNEYQAVYNTEATISYDFYSLSYPARWGRGLVVSLKNEFRRERLRDLTRNGERPAFGLPRNTVTTAPTLTYDQRDSPIHPTRGFLVSGQTELVFSEFDGTANLPVKATLTSQYIQSFFKRRLIFVPNLRLGAIWTQATAVEPKSGYYFRAGGDGVAYPVRGYADASIEACNGRKEPSYNGMCDAVFPTGVSAEDDFAVPERIGGHALLMGGLEIRFPTFVLDNFWLAAFTDFGAVAPTWRDMAFDRVQTSVGGGLRWLVSGQIPLRFDVAYPLETNPFSQDQFRIHLNIFYTL